MLTIARDSGAGEYGNSLLVMCAPSVDRDVVGAGVVAGCQLLALLKEIVEQARRTKTEPVGGEPIIADRFTHEYQVTHRVFGRANTACGFDADLTARRVAKVAHGLQHDERDWQRRGWGDLAGAGLDEVATRDHREPRRALHVVVGCELAGLEDHLE